MWPSSCRPIETASATTSAKIPISVMHPPPSAPWRAARAQAICVSTSSSVTRFPALRARGGLIDHPTDHLGDGPGSRSARPEGGHRLFVGRIEHGRGHAAERGRLRGDPHRRERLVVEREELPGGGRASSRSAGPRRAPGRASPARARSAAACPAGSPARSCEPSTNSTMEWTTDCGWTTTSIRSNGMSNSRCASITSSPLFTRVAELIVTTGPMSQVGWASACSRGHVEQLARGCGRGTARRWR